MNNNRLNKLFKLNLSSERLKVNRIDMLIVLCLRKAQARERRIGEIKTLLDCLHLNEIMLSKRIDKLLELT